MITSRQVLIDRLGGKLSKESVNYRPSRGSDNIIMCSECMYFDGENSCMKVAGAIEKQDVCDLYESSPGPKKVQTKGKK